ncbi:SusC/RagA family TonB-linked outer membrane protein [Autumnicola psychrophila]|uniref:SusC/RagA family TonB-linked outer membrane protein n=1 Tax=Autumnicola psychrophila TaxID=3075592 RepID=A0ABU3DMR6_9FLAO|nr:SusC/RagA family TonB-linked outer membrane protein [Zunongwangia sp. F225]MDT0685010.1 SusC/RagA family TonB-linked outer membrane protein [Zunongwangia sp. F225]
MKHYWYLLCVVFLPHIGAMAKNHELYLPKADTALSILDKLNQQTTVTGQVTDENGVPVLGVTVFIEGTSTGTTTDFDGNYSIEVPDENSILVFTSIGFSRKEVTVGNQSVIDISLEPDVTSLNEVVVTGLGIKRESKKLGYAVTSVDPEELTKGRTVNVMESLEGQVAGLNITPPAAGAGSSMQIRLRGQSAFAGASNSPLIVINGLPMDQGARGANGRDNNRDTGDNLQGINPDDIESMTVLKGATAAAIYGARAANGAVIITTKSGSLNQGIGVEFNSNITFSNPLNFIDEIRQTQYGQGTGGNRPQTQGEAQSTGQFGFGARLDGQPSINFDGVERPYRNYSAPLFDYLRTGTNITNTIGLSGGNEKGSFRASFANTKAEGITPANEYKRRIFNIGVNQNITDKLSLLLNVNYSNEENINPPEIGTQGPGAANFFNRLANSVPESAYEQSAIDPETGAELRTNGFLGTINNPYYQLQKGQFYIDDRKKLLGTATLRYEFTDWLYLQGRYNYDYSTTFNESNSLNGAGATTIFEGDTGFYRGQYNVGQQQSTDINADFLLGANQEFGKFSVDASFGGNTWRSKFQNQFQFSRLFVVPDLYSISNGTNFETDNGVNPYSFSQFRINSLYGLAEFGFNDLLFLNVTGRQDWFSVLNPENNSVFYPSVSGSFIFSELVNGQDWLNYGKLRGSWAEVGSVNGVGTYEGVLNYSINPPLNGQTTASVAGGSAPNRFLQPFTVTEKEIGIEMRMFDNRLRLDVGAFDKVTTDQILDVNISNASGYTESKQNIASLRNSGLETLIEYSPIRSENFNWTTSWNNAYLSTEVLDVGNDSGTILVVYFNGTGNEFLGELRYTEGLPMNQLYTRTYRRNEQGQILVNDDGRLLATNSSTPGAEETNGFLPVGSSIPKHTGGWNNNFSYKNFNFSFLIDYKLGGTVLSSTLLNMTRQGHSKLSLDGRREGENGIIVPNSVYESNGQTNTTAVSNLQGFYADYRNLQIGDPFTYKSDFVKLRTVSLSYNFTDMLSNVASLKFVKGLTLMAACRNVAILHKDLPGLDPEAVQSSGDFRAGYENAALPTTRNYTFSLNLKF